MKIRIKKESEDVPTPFYIHGSGDSGFDFRLLETIYMVPGEIVKVPTGLYFEIPETYELQIRPRSSSIHREIFIVFGTVDCSYRGMVYYTIINLARDVIKLNAGERIAQGVIAPVQHAEFEVVDDMLKTKRGSGSFGSTGF